MKKNYIKPVIGKLQMDSFLLTPSVNHVDSTEAAQGSFSDPVNLARGSFWDDSE